MYFFTKIFDEDEERSHICLVPWGGGNEKCPDGRIVPDNDL